MLSSNKSSRSPTRHFYLQHCRLLSLGICAELQQWQGSWRLLPLTLDLTSALASALYLTRDTLQFPRLSPKCLSHLQLSLPFLGLITGLQGFLLRLCWQHSLSNGKQGYLSGSKDNLHVVGLTDPSIKHLSDKSVIKQKSASFSIHHWQS